MTDATADARGRPVRPTRTLAPAGLRDRPADATFGDWIAVTAGAVGALMASLDISITNSALPRIQGEVGASGTEGTWISTGYLVSEVVMIPLAAWLTRVFGLRTFLLGCTTLFTLFSIMCGLAHSLPEMIIGRVGQGFTGGALIPTAQTIAATRLPRHQLPVGMTMFGLIVLLGPLVGPVLGGWLAENVSWSWCFFINIPVFFVLATLLILGLPHTPMDLDRLIKADWFGILGMTIGLSCLTVVLEEGQRERWFESAMITKLAIASVFGFAVLAATQVFVREPVIKLRLLLNRSYAAVILIVLVVGAVLYGVLYILPQFLANVSGYNAYQSGVVLLVSGFPAFAMMPILPRLLGKVSGKLLIILGLGCLAASSFINSHLSADTGAGDFFWPQILRGLGQVCAMMPLNQASMGAVELDEVGDAAGLYNMARNLGGSIGLALLGVFIDRRNEMHSDAIRETLNANSLLVQDRVAADAAGFAAQGGDLAHAHAQALGQIAAQIDLQALVMTYGECFWALGIALILSMPVVLLLRSSRGLGPARPSGGH